MGNCADSQIEIKNSVFEAGANHKRPLFQQFPSVTSIGSLPSDTKLLLTKKYSEINIFEKLRISYVIPWKSPSFPEISTVQNPSRITKNNSQGIIFVILSCQRVPAETSENPADPRRTQQSPAEPRDPLSGNKRTT